MQSFPLLPLSQCLTKKIYLIGKTNCSRIYLFLLFLLVKVIIHTFIHTTSTDIYLSPTYHFKCMACFCVAIKYLLICKGLCYAECKHDFPSMDCIGIKINNNFNAMHRQKATFADVNRFFEDQPIYKIDPPLRFSFSNFYP